MPSSAPEKLPLVVGICASSLTSNTIGGGRSAPSCRDHHYISICHS
jgi:hypothetical protein